MEHISLPEWALGALEVCRPARCGHGTPVLSQHLGTRLKTVGGHIIGVSCRGTVQLLHCTYTLKPILYFGALAKPLGNIICLLVASILIFFFFVASPLVAKLH